jgi:peptide/nickel transport system permease protein
VARYFLSRAGDALIAIWGVVTIVFIAARLSGDPTVLMLPVGATDAQLAELRQALGLDRPLLVQYGNFLADVLRGNFGDSFQHHRPAFDVVLERFPYTALLAFTALALGTAIGALGGFLAARYPGTTVEFIAMTIALVGQATPVFWLGILLILVFAVNLGWLPTGGAGTWRNLVLPAITLAAFTSASIARLLRSSMLNVLREDYIRTAWAKGLRARLVYGRHAVRNALIPVVTMIGILAGELLGGAVVIETVFAWPGVGRVIIQAIEAKDFSVVQAGVFLIAVVFVLVNFAVDLLYGLLDPRIRLSR